MLTGIGLLGGESFSKAGGLAVVSIIVGLLGGGGYYFICRRSNWVFIFVLGALLSVLTGDHGVLIAPNDSFRSRLEFGLGYVIGACVAALVVCTAMAAARPRRMLAAAQEEQESFGGPPPLGRTSQPHASD